MSYEEALTVLFRAALVCGNVPVAKGLRRVDPDRWRAVEHWYHNEERRRANLALASNAQKAFIEMRIHA